MHILYAKYSKVFIKKHKFLEKFIVQLIIHYVCSFYFIITVNTRHNNIKL